MATPPPFSTSISHGANRDILSHLQAVADCIIEFEDLDDVLEHIASAATHLTQADAATVHIFDFESGTLNLVRGYDFGASRHFQPTLRIGEGLLGTVVRSGRAYKSGDAPADPAMTDKDCAGIDKPGAVLCVPMYARGRTFGCITVYRNHRQAFGEQDLPLLNILAAEATQAVEKARLVGELQAQATLDALTGLLNKASLVQKLDMEVSRSLHRHQPVSLVYIDVDNFKAYNDVHGCLMGDKLLHDFTRVVCDHCRKIDLVGRLQGDDFIIVAPQTDTGGALALAGKIQRAVDQFSFLSSRADESYHTTCSIGVATFPEHGIITAELLERAGQALHASKRRGTSHVSIWSNHR